jgi:flagellar hook-associated protein 3 FlgL
MSTRVSTNQYIGTFISQINTTKSNLEMIRNQISSGLKVATPSDDAGRSSTILDLQSLFQRIEAHQKRVVLATNYIEVQENAVSNANEVLMRVQELATQAANGSVTHEVRRQIADEVYQLRDQLVSFANTKYQGGYIYGGFNDSAQPFQFNDAFYPTPAAGEYPAANGRFILQSGPGQNSSRNVQISDNESIRITSTAQDVFLNAINAVELLGRSLAGVRTDLIDTTGDGNPDSPDPGGTHLPWDLPDEYELQSAAIRDALDRIRSARVNDIERELSNVGARINRLQQTNQILDTLKINTDISRSNIQDVDIFEVSSQFANLQTSLEALLASGAQISRLSLLDYI